MSMQNWRKIKNPPTLPRGETKANDRGSTLLSHSLIRNGDTRKQIHVFAAQKLSPLRLTGAQPLPSPVPLPAHGGSSLVRILQRIFPITVIAIIIWDKIGFVKGFWGFF
jgi:hypothetical protein